VPDFFVPFPGFVESAKGRFSGTDSPDQQAKDNIADLVLRRSAAVA